MYKILHFDQKSLKMQQGRQPHKTIMTTSEIGNYKGRTGHPPPEKCRQDKGKIKVILYMTNHFLLMGSGLEHYFFVRTEKTRKNVCFFFFCFLEKK